MRKDGIHHQLSVKKENLLNYIFFGFVSILHPHSFWFSRDSPVNTHSSTVPLPTVSWASHSKPWEQGSGTQLTNLLEAIFQRMSSESQALSGPEIFLDIRMSQHSWTFRAGPRFPGMGMTHEHVRASLVAQRVKNSPAIQETWIRSLGLEDPLEEIKATHSGILAWRIPGTEELGGLQSIGLQRIHTTERLSTLWMCEVIQMNSEVAHTPDGELHHRRLLEKVSQAEKNKIKRKVSEIQFA